MFKLVIVLEMDIINDHKGCIIDLYYCLFMHSYSIIHKYTLQINIHNYTLQIHYNYTLHYIT